ncbi:2-C-methyl-D-erythritol 4-phosphate cytidylyltransferase [Deinococcus seoulensis]|uniref:2-C-methyl-D-erythritol 4-phosphate cytidylyltransferase n=2 Tax=Deinococcus TaxID=1298 RepID=A0ABQ2RY06_9DEIO|nr:MULTISPECIES: 2-C-methyl-D-erythritol 4-phosphate cytidylyltransferase [Deinococcus]GGR70382.1 2-C-methyl-D-erythritol 4-phosphate cytidylyltransferase [Deinococcus seoulensis]GGS42135.1 2-C-methyl-D-erythritol 4-phosphate cytidylyltransferase [Deinococcus knuensis]
MRVAALIPAAGSGTRLGLGPKAFVPVEGRTLLGRSAAALAPHVHEVLIALPAGLDLPGDVPGRAVVGGDTRQASVLALLRATDADVVLIHDAARPFLPARVIRDLLAAVQEVGAATAALPVADTLVRADPAGSWGTLTPREGLWAVQTPQAFRRAALIAAHEAALADGHAATDDAGLIARAGQPVALVPGDARLLKVTTPGDLLIAQALARVWDAEVS